MSTPSTQTAPAPRFEFDAGRHLYLLDGRPIPSVTQVIGESGVVDYSFCAPEHLLRGTYVHQACQFYDEGCLDEESVDPAIRPYLDAYILFRREAGFIPDLIERRLYYAQFQGVWHGWHPTLKYAGTLDRTGTLANHPGKWLIDLKSGVPNSGVMLQLAAYAALMPDPRAYNLAAVYLRRNGTYSLSPVPSGQFDLHFAGFSGALALYNWKRTMGLVSK